MTSTKRFRTFLVIPKLENFLKARKSYLPYVTRPAYSITNLLRVNY